MSDRLLVSGCDSNFYPLLRELLASLHACEEISTVDIAVLDGGMTEAQLEEIKPLVTKILKPDWPEGIPEKKTRKSKESNKTGVCRPYLRDLFPGYQTYMWIDADVWVQNWAGVEIFLTAAQRYPNKIVVTNGADRSYKKQFRLKWIGAWPYRFKNFYFSNGRETYGLKTAKAMSPYFVFCAGCFALSGASPLWDVWQKCLVEASQKGKLFTADQMSLGKMIYRDGYQAEILPAYSFWTCAEEMLWDGEKKIFVEPYTPHEEIGMLHLSGIDALRGSHKEKKKFKTLQGGEVELPLRYPEMDAGDLPVYRPKRN